ncbi:hypothetical protein, variant 2 [Puccinia triticina 1-1 BBBD Race 1]|uniref:Alpha 1,4-glycosyltransferase domain-containing protein n=1 Tax=Puccinia triticina (isolate 1-1 / race 1 (BBBD)) TaxID=630390 RepID=A0A0C4ENX4_PUCT1|nr:hypothetical protein PTTG_02471 [Puccinia triticina 1-1 BBBD Race 1]OAV98967.1 hypothetical protein, variant 1 [Puccinia triticina 1-1 BBBD Race 1]OAV98968.1 hypothetical protein, variant 2 [Puccinia triticina 1-1 BBBD Race 1]
MWKLPTSRRFWALIIAISILVIIFWQHIFLLARILLVYPLWSTYSSSLSLSIGKDGLDPTFEKYPVEQWSVKWPPRSANGSWPAPDSSLLRLSDGSLARLPDERYGGGVSYSEPDELDLVPPILHHILLGMDRRLMPKTWTASRNSCLALHPESANFTHHFWDDQSAEEFMRKHYSFFLRDFLDYRHTIQRADALRYFVLHHYGGIFLDMDLECRRSLGPLRRFPIVNINASPVGVSNGFMMAQAKHPFLEQLIKSLQYYDHTWFGVPYFDIMLSTGPMFLSTEHLHFPADHRSTQLRVLAERQHRLNGRVATPLFRHLGASSWHQGDAKLFLKIRVMVYQPFFSLMLFCGFIGGSVGWMVWKKQIAKPGVDRSWSHSCQSSEVRRFSAGRLILWRFGLGSRRGHRRTPEEYERIEMDLESPLIGDRRLSPILEVEEEVEAKFDHELEHKHSILNFGRKRPAYNTLKSPTTPSVFMDETESLYQIGNGSSSGGSCPSTSSDPEDDGSSAEAVVVLIDRHPSKWRN